MTDKFIPTIRFGGYIDAWEQRKLGEITDKIGSGKTPRGGSANYSKNGIPLLRSQNIYSNRVNFEDVVFITEQTNENMKNSVVKKNDVLLNITGASIGRSAVYQSLQKANVNQHVCIIRIKDDINPYFIQLNLSSPNGQNQISLNQAGGGREGLNFKQISKMKFVYPIFKEQIQIGNFFKQLDDTIALHQRELELIKESKKGFLQKMFPKNDEKVPEIRFPGFTDAWEQRKLGELLNEVKRPVIIEDNKEYELVTVKRRNGGVVSRGIFKGKDILVKKYFALKKDDYLISKRQVVHGANGIVPKNMDGAVVSNEYLISVGNELITTNYLTIISQLPQMYKMFFLSSYGIDIEKLVFNVEDWKKRIINIPNIEEQTQIGSFFKQLDDTIALHQRKLEVLKELKKGYLQKMFV